MKKQSDLVYETNPFTVERLGEIIIVRFKQNRMALSTDLDVRNELRAYFDALSRDNSLKVIVLFGYREKPPKRICRFFSWFILFRVE